MENESPLSFGRLLMQLRVRAAMTQEQLAESAKVSVRSVSDLERGHTTVLRRETARLLADALRLAGDEREQFVALARGRAAVGAKWDFFVSYTQADRAWAEWIAWTLESDGYRLLVQAWDFGPGGSWVAGMEDAIKNSARTIAVLSGDYLRSVYGQSEWQAAWASDPSGTRHNLLVVRVADCPRPGLLAGVVGVDLFDVGEKTARGRLLEVVNTAVAGRAKPPSAPGFPGRSWLDPGFLEEPGTAPTGAPAFPSAIRLWEVIDVFQPTGVPEVTFVQPDWFAEFLMALRQPGLSVVLEGPSGAGKTTLLQHAIAADSRRLGRPRRFTAREPADVTAIADLVNGGNHEGIVAVDDFHRLPAGLQSKAVDYLKLLADRGDRTRKLVIVGIPRTAQSLVQVSFDVANRIRVFDLKRAPDWQVFDLIEQGENALNVEFEDKPALVKAARGSLITAQSLCSHLMSLARIEETMPELTVVPTNVGEARKRVFRELWLKYHQAVAEFTTLDDQAESACIDLLLKLAAEPDGVMYLDAYAEKHRAQARRVEAVLTAPASEAVSRVLYYDSQSRRLIADDPQFIFYIQHLDRQELMQDAGKRLPPARHRIFICYSHTNAAWLKRLLVHLGSLHKDEVLDVWSDERIQVGDDWRTEIDTALAAARVAVLLVSADFYDSTFIREVELPELLAASAAGGCKVMPLLVSASRFRSDPTLSRFQVANPCSLTLASITPEAAEEVLVNLAAAIEKEIRQQ